MEGRANESVGVLHMGTLAALSILALLGIGAWKTYENVVHRNSVVSTSNSSLTVQEARTPYSTINWQTSPAKVFSDDEATTTDPDGISHIGENVMRSLMGSYTALSESGSYTPQEGEKIAEGIASSLRADVSYRRFSESDIKTDANVSYDRMLSYRNDLRIALEPLLKNPGYELTIFAQYIDSRDPKYLDELKTAAENYKNAVENAAQVIVPQDALSHHVAILNSLSEFGATIERMTEHADDAFASAALLRTYNTNELNLFTSFNSLALFYKNHHE